MPAAFVLVPGSWHGAWCFGDVVERLEGRGHVARAVTLTGVGEKAYALTPEVNLSTHVDDVVGLIARERLGPVRLVGHSSSGLVITHAGVRLATRVAELVYLDAYLPASGQSALDVMRPDYAERVRQRTAAEGEGYRVPVMLDARALGITDPERARWVDAQLTPHPVGAYEERLPYDERAWSGLNRRFLHCAGYDGFGRMAERAEQLGLRVQRLACGHDAMLAAPDELVAALLR